MIVLDLMPHGDLKSYLTGLRPRLKGGGICFVYVPCIHKLMNECVHDIVCV